MTGLLAADADSIAASPSIAAHASDTTGWCSPPPLRAWAVSKLGGLVSGMDAEAISTRRLYGLDPMNTDTAVVVTDERVCERAAREYYRHRLGPVPAGGVSVFRIGNRYLVEGANRAGEWVILTVYSAHFEPIANIAQ